MVSGRADNIASIICICARMAWISGRASPSKWRTGRCSPHRRCRWVDRSRAAADGLYSAVVLEDDDRCEERAKLHSMVDDASAVIRASVMMADAIARRDV